MSTDGEAVQDTRRAEQERITGRKRARKDRRVNNRWQGMDTRAADRDDVWRLGGGARPTEQVGIIVRDKHAGDQDSEDIENHNAPEHAINSF